MIKLNKHITNDTISFTSGRLLYGYYEFRFRAGNLNRRYFVNDIEIGHEIFFNQHHYNI